MAKIGVVGSEGVVGNAVAYGLGVLGHKIICHDLKLNTKIDDLLDTDTIYICVPTPSNPDGSCDTRIVEGVVDHLTTMNYGGIIAIKSTVAPGTTDRLVLKHKNEKICFCPEVLKERSAVANFQDQDVCVVGTENQAVYESIVSQHGRYPRNTVRLSPTAAELFKYANNNYNAMLVTFANSYYEVCKALGVEWNDVKSALTKRDHITDIYMDVNDNLRAYAGVCLVKDQRAMMSVCAQMCPHVEFFNHIHTENEKYKKTVFDGMRLE